MIIRHTRNIKMAILLMMCIAFMLMFLGRFGSVFSEKITTHLAQAKKFPEPILIFFFLLHTLKFFDEFGINPVTVFLNKAYQFIHGLFGRNVLFNNILTPVEGYSTRP
jgi:hypothetical protein